MSACLIGDNRGRDGWRLAGKQARERYLAARAPLARMAGRLYCGEATAAGGPPLSMRPIAARSLLWPVCFASFAPLCTTRLQKDILVNTPGTGFPTTDRKAVTYQMYKMGSKIFFFLTSQAN
jgi:hypothetical protein